MIDIGPYNSIAENKQKKENEKVFYNHKKRMEALKNEYKQNKGKNEN